MKKKILSLILVGVMAMMMVACGGSDSDESADQGTEEVDLGTPIDVLDAIYENAELDPELTDQIRNGAFQQAELDESIASMFLGGANVEYANGAVSAPTMSSIAYQVVVLQLEEGQDVEAVKSELADTADVSKWVCVEPETVVVENNGNYVLFIMADTATADALVTAFLGL